MVNEKLIAIGEKEMARPISKTPEELRESARKRRERFVMKRNESGLRELKVYIDAETVKALDGLCNEMGYMNPSEGENLTRGEILANVVGYCIRKTAGCTKGKLPESTLEPHKAQSIYRIIRILKHRKLEVGHSNHRIAQFMTNHNYPKLDTLTVKKGSKATTPKWNSKDVEYALEPRNYRRLLNPK